MTWFVILNKNWYVYEELKEKVEETKAGNIEEEGLKFVEELEEEKEKRLLVETLHWRGW